MTLQSTDRFIVLARTYQIACDYCKEYNLSEHRMIYPSMTAMILGYDHLDLPIYRAAGWNEMDPRTLDEVERMERWSARAKQAE